MHVLNIIGSSAHTAPLSVIFAVNPDAPPTPEYVARNGGDSSIGSLPSITVKWESPSDDGGSPILGYLVSMSKDGGTWQVAYDGSVKPEVT